MQETHPKYQSTQFQRLKTEMENTDTKSICLDQIIEFSYPFRPWNLQMVNLQTGIGPDKKQQLQIVRSNK